MAGLFQGDPLPDVTTTTQTQATAPEFYTNYLQDIANLGQNAVQQGGVAGFSPLQQQAFQMVPDVAFKFTLDTPVITFLYVLVVIATPTLSEPTKGEYTDGPAAACASLETNNCP